MNIRTTPVFPPIPLRHFDWSAVDDDNYDASYEGEDETGSVWKHSPIGYGRTEQEAIDDLLAQLEEQ